MRGVLLNFDLPADWWGSRLTTRFDSLSIRFLNAVPTGGGRCVSTVQLHGAPIQQAAQWLRERHILDRALVMDDGDDFTARITSRDSLVAHIIEDTGAVPQFPFTVQGGRATWLMMEQSGAVQRLLAWCEAGDLACRTVRSGQWDAVLDELTTHQRATMEHAIDAGYYEYPRRITLTALAQRRGVSKSTLSESLMVIEHKVIGAHRSAHPPKLRPARASRQASTA